MEEKFDVFLCCNNQDKTLVKEIGEKLKQEAALRPWLDEWELRPGLPWQDALEKQIKNIKSVAIFVGKNSIGPWQNLEQAAFIRQFVKRQCPVIPVILPGCPEVPELPAFLEGMVWVDFRETDPDPMDQLVWGITGKRTTLK
ncbi:MAG: toll/interleukin-1 receptor domain-containing protein [Desulfobacteraceae bacterium]|nr:toll/interleukin-1 receptor domain-containing protein [Desulfobacteraceae bacterium]